MANSIKINKNLRVDQSMFDFLYNNQNNLIISIILGLETNPDLNYLSPTDKHDFVQFLPMSKWKDDIDPWGKRVGRTQMKVGRFIKKLIPEEYFERYSLDESNIESFVNLYKSWFRPLDYTLRVIEGEEIKKWYDEENYALMNGNQHGTLWKSCMRYRARLKFLDMYTKNPDVKMLVMLVEQDGEQRVRSRAILWDKVIVKKCQDETLPKEIKVMDRIYSLQDSDVTLFKTWAEKNGYIPKWEQSAKSHLFFDIKGQVMKIKCDIMLDKCDFVYYPYLDTFPYLNFREKRITNDEYSDWDYKLIQANGALEQEPQEEDVYEDNEDW